MAMPTLSSQTTIGEIKQVFRWNIVIPANAALAGVAVTDLERMCLMVQSFDEPSKDLEIAVANLRGVEWNQAGIARVRGEINFTILDNVGTTGLMSSQEIIDTLGNLCYDTDNPTGDDWGISRAPDQYKIPNIQIYRLSGDRTEVGGFNLYNSMFRSTKGSGYESGSSELAKIRFTLSFDAWYRLKRKSNGTAPTPKPSPDTAIT